MKELCSLEHFLRFVLQTSNNVNIVPETTSVWLRWNCSLVLLIRSSNIKSDVFNLAVFGQAFVQVVDTLRKLWQQERFSWDPLFALHGN